MLGLPGKSTCLENQCRMKSNHPLLYFSSEILNLHSVVLFFLNFPLEVWFNCSLALLFRPQPVVVDVLTIQMDLVILGFLRSFRSAKHC